MNATRPKNYTIILRRDTRPLRRIFILSIYLPIGKYDML